MTNPNREIDATSNYLVLCKRIIAAGEKGKRITNHENRLNRLNRQRQQAR